MDWLMSAKSLNFCQELGASVCEHHPNLREDEGNLIVDGRLLRMVWELLAEQAPASGQQGGTGEGGAVHEAPSAEGVGGGAVAPTIDTGMIRTSCDQFKFGVEHISVTPLLEGRHDLTAWLAQLRKGDDETAESYCNRTRTIRAELLTIGQEVHMATFAAHMLKGLPPDRPNKGVPPVRFQPSAMTALDADDEDNPYDVAYPAKDDCDTDSDDEVEYPNDDEEEEDT
ncbi:unnamed protein product [Closterium sp. NIES-64]|nr:unnamed protein product [Closterium sp. NIES-64]